VVAVAVCIIASTLLDSQAHGVAVVGAVQGGFPPIGLPQGVTLSDAFKVLGTAFSCFVLIVAQSAATSRSFAAKHGERVDINQDIVGLSAANFAAGLSGTFVVNGSPTKTQILNSQGGRTQLANMAMSAVVLLFTLFATGLLTNMPKATLAGIVFMIGVSLLDFAGLTRIRAARASEFYVAMLTCVVVFAIGVEQGIVLAIVASIVEIVRRAYRPNSFVVGDSADGQPDYVKASPGAESAPGLIIFRFDAELFYANVGRFVDDVKAVVEAAPHPVRWLLIDASSLSDVDYSASLQLQDLIAYTQERDIVFGVVEMDTSLQATLTAYGVLKDQSVKEHIYPTLVDGIAAFHASPAPAPSGKGTK
ncbi:MAG: SulP family inorganic anion transporter, partial [Propionicimonas sp.]